MDVTINSQPPAQSNPNSSTSQTGAAAAQTETQRADANVQRVTNVEEKSSLEDNTKNVEQKRFDLIKRTAASFSSGDNAFLSDIAFTVYNGSQATEGQYEIRFTDISTGSIEIKNDIELLGTSSAGELVSGSV